MKRLNSIFSLVLLSAILISSPVEAEELSKNIQGSVEIENESSSGENILIPDPEQIEMGNLGSISIQLEDTSKKLSKENVIFRISKVADVLAGEYVLTEECSGSNLDLNNIQNANELEVAASKLKEYVSGGSTAKTDKNGHAMISDLEVGVYLVYAENIAKYENISPCLVSIPTWNEEDKVMSYSIEVLPKHTPLPEPTPNIQTGVDNNVMVYGLLSLVFLTAAMISSVLYKKKEIRRKNEKGNI